MVLGLGLGPSQSSSIVSWCVFTMHHNRFDDAALAETMHTRGKSRMFSRVVAYAASLALSVLSVSREETCYRTAVADIMRGPCSGHRVHLMQDC
jgi:hypothetical protein